MTTTQNIPTRLWEAAVEEAQGLRTERNLRRKLKPEKLGNNIFECVYGQLVGNYYSEEARSLKAKHATHFVSSIWQRRPRTSGRNSQSMLHSALEWLVCQHLPAARQLAKYISASRKDPKLLTKPC